MLSAHTPLREVEGLQKPRVKGLERLGLITVGDALEHYPRRHEDRLRFDHFPTGPTEKALCLFGRIADTKIRRFGKFKSLFEARLVEAADNAFRGEILLTWFNLPYIHKLVAVGQQVVVYGKARAYKNRLSIQQPEFEEIEENSGELIHFNRITPVYPAGEGVPQRYLRALIYRLLREVDPQTLSAQLPEDLAGGMTRIEALQGYHFPESEEIRLACREYLVLAEWFGLQLLVAMRRCEWQALASPPRAGSRTLLDRFLAALPFSPTDAQTRCIEEIEQDLRTPTPMNRLLQGDVGSGKTLVALAAMLLTVESGWQAVLMAPTQILAEQHYANFCRWLEPLGVPVGILTGSRREESVLPLFASVGGGESHPRIMVGTHALLFNEEAIAEAGLVVVDEQHKFGVLQRAHLMGRAAPPDVLVMTATPIPRTLALSVYGDLEVSLIDSRPGNRGRIITGVRDNDKLPDAVAFLRKQIEAGRQAYVVYPLVEESEKLAAKAVTVEFERWSELMKPFRCELLHGRLSGEEKEAAMRRFRENQSQVLVATSVIEVGIDVPNATVLIVENAERFGLAQLHQLRGRIGRGIHNSYCVLLTDTKNEATLEKLKILEESSDGFRIAERDMELRGPGDLLGTAQSGALPLKLANPVTDLPLLIRARDAARAKVGPDPKLLDAKNRDLHEWTKQLTRLNLSNIS